MRIKRKNKKTSWNVCRTINTPRTDNKVRNIKVISGRIEAVILLPFVCGIYNCCCISYWLAFLCVLLFYSFFCLWHKKSVASKTHFFVINVIELLKVLCRNFVKIIVNKSGFTPLWKMALVESNETKWNEIILAKMKFISITMTVFVLLLGLLVLCQRALQQ